MAGKSKHKRGKHIQRQKGKSRQHLAATPSRQPAGTETSETVAQPKASAPPRVKAPTRVAKPTTAQYAYIGTELRTIGILAGIMLTALVVLSLVLP